MWAVDDRMTERPEGQTGLRQAIVLNDAGPDPERVTALAEQFRASWSKKDRERAVRALQDLAPLCDYRVHRLACAVQVTRRTLERIFAAITGHSPRHWLNRERLQAARRLLLSYRSVKDVAYSLGYPAPSQFCRDFRGEFGMTPSNFARQHADR
jgi:AraC-like DNA-binding protein